MYNDAGVAQFTELLNQSLENPDVVSLETIYRISNAAEFGNDNVNGHIERISHYSTAVARKIGMGESFLQNILFAAPLHDVGKVGIPDSILNKPGKLSEDEWQIVMQHSRFGLKILKENEADFLKMAREIAATHHEKWDGSGYPLGLKGTQIPLAGRIVALTDVFDVITWERPYQLPIPIERAFVLLLEGSGSHFDPAVVDAFSAIREEIVAEFNWWQFLDADNPAS